MNNRNLTIVLIVVVLILIGAIAYVFILLTKTDTGNNTSNTTNNLTNNTTVYNNQQSQVNRSSESNIISAAKAISIANQYLTSQGGYFHAGSASLKNGVYYVEILESRDDAQAAKGTLLGYVKVDAKTGSVLGEQTWDIETGETIDHPPGYKP